MKLSAAARCGRLALSALGPVILSLTVLPSVSMADGNEALNENYRVFLKGGAVAAGVGLRGAARPGKPGIVPRSTNQANAGTPRSNGKSSPKPNDLGFGTITLSGIPAGATVTKAFLYWALIGPADSNPVRIQGQEITGTIVGISSGNCWESQGTLAYRADVTGIVTGNGNYFLDSFPTFQTSDADTQGAAIVAIYSDPASPMRTIVINDGSTVVDGYNVSSASTTFTGLLPLQGGLARSIYLVADGDSYCQPDEQLYFNGSLVADSPFVSADGAFWDTTSVNVTGAYAAPSSTTTLTSDCDCLQWVGTVLVADASVTPTGKVSGGGTVCAGSAASIQADLTGTPPWTLTWSDGFEHVVTTSPAIRTVTPTYDRSYTLVNLFDTVGQALPNDLTGQATVVVKPVPSSEITTGGTVCSLRGGLSACVPDAGAGATYSWQISGGTLTSANNARCVTFTAASSGTLALTATVTKDGCSSTSVKATEIGQVPVTPKPLMPLSGTGSYELGFVSWIRIDNQTYPPGTRFDLYFDTVSPPEKLLFTDILDNYDAYVPVWFPNVTYYWDIVAKTPCGTAHFATPASYTAGNCTWTSQPPLLKTPAGGATDLPTQVTLEWDPVPGASHYDVYLDAAPASPRLYRVLAAPATSLDVSLAAGKTYSWKVVASPACGTFVQLSSEVRTFSTAPGRLAVTSFSPGWVNRFAGSAVQLAGTGFLATSAIFTDLDGQAAGAITPGIFLNSFSSSTLLTADLAANPTAPAGLYDTGAITGGVESGRLLQSLAVRAFTDVTENDYYFLSSARVSDAKIMSGDFLPGTPGPQFAPATPILRGEMAQYLARAYRWWRFRDVTLPPATCVAPAFADIPCNHPLWLEIYWLKTWKVTFGKPCGADTCYKPDEFVTRAELVTFLQRMRQTEVLFGPRYDLESTVGQTDPGCSQPYPACKGWTDLNYPDWPRRDVNVAFNDRMTKGCAGVPGNNLAFCPFTNVTRAEIAEFLARILGLVPTP